MSTPSSHRIRSIDDREIHFELALELVRKLRRRGGRWRLVQTGLLVTAPLWIVFGAQFGLPIAIVAGVLGTLVLGRNLVQNHRAIQAATFLERVDLLHPRPFAAVMKGRLLKAGD